jgi:hypothetical protein
MEPYREAKPDPNLRASDAERDVVVGRLQVAFAEGRLDDEEFDDRMRTALAARTHADLGRLLTDLPASAAAVPEVSRPSADGSGPAPGRYAVAYKNSLRHAGRWRVPGTFRAVVYKGFGLIDLRAAELTEPVTTIVAVAYKSDIEVIVPPGIGVEVSGVGAARDHDWAGAVPADAPVVHVRAIAYKGRVDVLARSRR